MLAWPAPARQEDEALPTVVRQRRSRLERDSLLSKLRLERVERDGHVWLVQLRHGDGGTRIERALARLRPWFERCEALYDSEIARPAGFGELGDRLPVATVVMASREDFVNYAERKTWQCPVGMAGLYDPYLAITVTYDEPTLSATGRRHARWESRAHAWVHALQQSYARLPERICGPYWIDEGVAHHLVSSGPRVVDDLEAGANREVLRARLANAALQGGHDARASMRLDELLDPRDLAAVGTWVREATANAEEPVEAYWSRMATLSIQSGALVSFLLEEERPYRDGFLRFLRSCAKGRGGPERFYEELGLDADARRALEVEFWRDCIEAWIEAEPAESADLEPVGGAPAVVHEAFGLATGEHPGAGTKLSGDTWAELGVRDGDPGRLVSLALARGARGDFAAAADMLHEAPGAASNSQAHARLTRFRERLRGIADEVRAELEARIASGESLRVRLPDGWVRAPLVALEGDRVRLGSNRKNALFVPYDGELRTRLARAALDEAREPERRERLALVHALKDDRRAWSVAEEVGGDRGERLRSDLETVEAHLAATAVLEPLDALSRFGAEGAPSGTEALERIGTLVGEHGDDPLVVERTDLLRLLAKQALLRDWDAARAIEALNPTRHLIDRGLLHLTYDFDDPSELEDFEAADDYDSWYEGVAEDLTALEDSRGSTLEGGAWVLHGFRTYRHRMHFNGPTEARIRFRYRAVGDAQLVGMYLTAREDGTGKRSLTTSQGNDLRQIRDWRVVGEAGDSSPLPSYPDRTYEVVLNYDGESVATVQAQGEITATSEVGDLEPGTTAIVVVSDWPCRIESIELRGDPDVGASVALRDAWIARKLGDLGFGTKR